MNTPPHSDRLVRQHRAAQPDTQHRTAALAKPATQAQAKTDSQRLKLERVDHRTGHKRNARDASADGGPMRVVHTKQQVPPAQRAEQPGAQLMAQQRALGPHVYTTNAPPAHGSAAQPAQGWYKAPPTDHGRQNVPSTNHGPR